MKEKETSVTYGNIQLVSPYDMKSLHQLRIIREVNDHARFQITGIIPEEKVDSYIERASSTDTIELNQLQGKQVVRPLFRGIVSTIEIQTVRGVYMIQIEALSHTYQLDTKRKQKSFQNKNMRYTEMIETILARYPGSDYIDTASHSAKLETCIIQYRETDWSFLKRMASHFGTVLIPDATAKTPKFWFGVAEGRPRNLENPWYQVQKTLAAYRQVTENHDPDLQETDCTTYTIETTEYLNIGDELSYNGAHLRVSHAIATLKQGILQYTYTLTPEKGWYRPREVHPHIAGVSIEGKALEVAGDQVKLHLCIDPKQKKEEACWFPYTTPYTAEGHSGWYCMPEVGDTVSLYMPNGREEEAVVRGALRKKKPASIQNPAVKRWGTPFGKNVKVDATEMVFTATKTEQAPIFLKLNAGNGIGMQSEEPIHVTSNKSIEIMAGNALRMTAQEAVYMRCGASSIVMDGITDIQSPSLTMGGTVRG
ncbi:late control gene D protein (GPD) [Aneurinibacillus soli]|uniref:Uncharacterized protein n=1 Tax=Aneurinibacillus soli TaxID=1500254 RepID=A0A0U5B1N1_9BACL|nr:contractile injection system protein, VgrG/Pvc8 family [Aneurinibacillus soli]PYE60385.1 late control gene D protein (GPD) [Aneurinibacillus soli]BAU27215.1 hypothetical protein CB4_01384 [Aneurinibacillus soli]